MEVRREVDDGRVLIENPPDWKVRQLLSVTDPEVVEWLRTSGMVIPDDMMIDEDRLSVILAVGIRVDTIRDAVSRWIEDRRVEVRVRKLGARAIQHSLF